MAKEPSPTPRRPSSPEESRLPVGQREMIEYIRELGLEVTAETYAYQNSFNDIEELTAEELAEIPQFLLDEYNERKEREEAEDEAASGSS